MLLQHKPVLTRTYIVRQKKRKAENDLIHCEPCQGTLGYDMQNPSADKEMNPFQPSVLSKNPNLRKVQHAMGMTWASSYLKKKKVGKKSPIVLRIVRIQIQCYVPYVQRDTTRTVMDGSPGRPPRPSHSSGAVKSSRSLYVHIHHNFSSNSLTCKSNITVDNTTYCIF